MQPTESVSAPAPAGRWALVLVGLALLLAAFGVVFTNWRMFAGDGRPSLQGVDDTGYYLWLRSGVIDGDFDFANDLAAASTLRAAARDAWLEAPRTAIGRVANKYPPGWAFATLPAFLVGHAGALITGAPADGWSRPYFVAVWVWHLGLAALGLGWAWRVAERFAPREIAAVAVLAVWIASPLVYYGAARVGMVHGLLFTLIACAYHYALQMRDHPAVRWRWWVVGLVCSLTVLVRASSVLYLIFPAWVAATELGRLRGRARIARVIALLVPALAGGALLVGATWSLHGTGWTEPYPGEPFNWGAPRIWAVLFSPLHGLFYWHPLTLVGLIGAVWAMVRHEVPRVWAITLAATWYLNAAWHAWWFGSSFGNRAFEGVMLFAMVGLAWLFGHLAATRRTASHRALAWGTGVAVVAGALLFVLFLTQAIPREEPVTFGDMLGALFRPLRQVVDPVPDE